MLFIALITVAGFGIYLNKIGARSFRRIMAFELYLDLAVDLVLVYMFAGSGTLGGAMLGAMAGLLFNVMLFFMKRMNGWDELRTVQCPACKQPHRQWITHQGAGWLFWIPRVIRQRFRRRKVAASQ